MYFHHLNKEQEDKETPVQTTSSAVTKGRKGRWFPYVFHSSLLCFYHTNKNESRSTTLLKLLKEHLPYGKHEKEWIQYSMTSYICCDMHLFITYNHNASWEDSQIHQVAYPDLTINLCANYFERLTLKHRSSAFPMVLHCLSTIKTWRKSSRTSHFLKIISWLRYGLKAGCVIFPTMKWQWTECQQKSQKQL